MQAPLAKMPPVPEIVRYLKLGFGGAHTASNHRLM
jgi:hypothetical protein